MRRALPFVLIAGLLVAAGLRDAVDDWVTRTDLPALTVETSVEVLAADGALLRAFTVADGRWRLAPGPVDADFINMLLDYEDRRFLTHHGVDLRAFARAGLQAIWNGHIVSGGSTLTMQVARLLEDSGTGHVAGKLRQIRVALALERRLTKPQILALYLQLAPYGGNVEGVRAAALAYFGKEPRRLTPAEAALLVSIPQSPETRRPDRFGTTATAARDRVLDRMVSDGILTSDKADAARTEVVPVTRKPFPAHAPHLAQALRVADPLAQTHPTTIDASVQSALEKLAAQAAHRSGDKLSLAILVADHRTGAIIASVGSPDWTDDSRAGFVDMTQAIRSPGSTLKPFIYGLAFDTGLAHPETLIDDRPIAFGSYAPQNFDRTFRGTLPVREALQLSLNIPAVALTDALGPAQLVSALNRAGVTPQIPGDKPGLAIALGGLGLTLQDLVQAYAALARLGDPIHLSVTPGQAKPLSQRLFRREAAWMVGDILSGLAPPPGAPADRLAYKTGTSYGHRDAWALGFDGAHVAGVWIGRPDGSPVPGAFGGELAAPVLFEVFGRLGPTIVPLPPPPPATLMVPNAQLPQPLQHFRPRRDILASTTPDAPVVAFPPDGATLETAGPLTVKVRNGTPPFTWLANGAPVAIAERRRETALTLSHAGDFRLSVIDAAGRSASVAVTVGVAQ